MLLPFAVFIASAHAAIPTSPKAIVAHLYAHPHLVYTTRDTESLSPHFFTPRLRHLYQQDRKNTPEGYAPNLDFDFLSNSQDPEISQVSATAGPVTDDRQTVTVRFLEMKDPQVLEYDFQRLDGVWLIDEVRCPMKGHEWILSRILKGKP